MLLAQRVCPAAWALNTWRDAWDRWLIEIAAPTKAQGCAAHACVQVPLKLAWAVTVHKSQDMSLDKVLIDADSFFRSHGLLYTALSRARSLAGLQVVGKNLAEYYRVRGWVEGREGINSRNGCAHLLCVHHHACMDSRCKPMGQLWWGATPSILRVLLAT